MEIFCILYGCCCCSVIALRRVTKIVIWSCWKWLIQWQRKAYTLVYVGQWVIKYARCISSSSFAVMWPKRVIATQCPVAKNLSGIYYYKYICHSFICMASRHIVYEHVFFLSISRIWLQFNAGQRTLEKSITIEIPLKMFDDDTRRERWFSFVCSFFIHFFFLFWFAPVRNSSHLEKNSAPFPVNA